MSSRMLTFPLEKRTHLPSLKYTVVVDWVAAGSRTLSNMVVSGLRMGNWEREVIWALAFFHPSHTRQSSFSYMFGSNTWQWRMDVIVLFKLLSNSQNPTPGFSGIITNTATKCLNPQPIDIEKSSWISIHRKPMTTGGGGRVVVVKRRMHFWQ